MKRILALLLLLLFISPVFAKTVQRVKKYQVYNGAYSIETNDVTPQIQSMIDKGWEVVSITPITIRCASSNPTDYVIVLYEKEEE